MKTQEEIEKLAFQKYPKYIIDPYNPAEDGNKEERDIWIDGYNQCQEDNADKKYTEGDIEKAIEFGINAEAGNIKRNYSISGAEQFIQSLNK